MDHKREDKTFCGGLEEPDVLPDPGRARCVCCSSPAGSFLPHAVAENAERHHFSDAQTPLNSRDLHQKRHILKTYTYGHPNWQTMIYVYWVSDHLRAHS